MAGADTTDEDRSDIGDVKEAIQCFLESKKSTGRRIHDEERP